MKIFKSAGIALFSIIFLASVSYGADVAKIGVVDFQEIFINSDAGKAADVKFKKKGEELKSKLMKKGNEIEELKSKFERESLVMSKEQRDERARDIRIKINDYKLMEKKSKDELKQVNAALAIEIRNDVLKIIEEIGKSEGYLMVVDKPAVLYNPGAIEITDRIIKKYNKLNAKKK